MNGQHQSELDTPALCIDIDCVQRNIHSMIRQISEGGKQWRPHVGGHNSTDIALHLMQAGAIGVTVSNVSEAELFVRAGIEDVLIANMVVGEQKLQRVARLCDLGSPIVACDHFAQAEALSDICRQHGKRCRVLIDVDLGMHRSGVRPGPDARRLAQGINSLSGVTLMGVMGYEGHLCTITNPELKQTRIITAMSILEELRNNMRKDGICCDVVSAGATGAYQSTVHHSAVTEVQCGGGIFGDPYYTENCHVQDLVSATKILATVTSRPALERAVIDVGRSRINADLSPPRISHTVLGRPLPDVTIVALSAEQSTLELGPESQSLIIGDKVEVTPGHTASTLVLNKQIHWVSSRKKMPHFFTR